MDSGELVFVASRLVLGAVAAVLAIMLWSRTRDGAWMLVVLAVIFSYIDSVYYTLELFGVTEVFAVKIGNTNLIKIILFCAPTFFLISAFVVMLLKRKRRGRRGALNNFHRARQRENQAC
ncbi:MAG: hypothetical protein LBC53_05235 [Spirochaetaceae bacterium]|jgi:hypothetical protein|nr:hypothetical protein [Spirochaetaceae bacterium]